MSKENLGLMEEGGKEGEWEKERGGGVVGWRGRGGKGKKEK